jgi:hypothetical protein
MNIGLYNRLILISLVGNTIYQVLIGVSPLYPLLVSITRVKNISLCHG